MERLRNDRMSLLYENVFFAGYDSLWRLHRLSEWEGAHRLWTVMELIWLMWLKINRDEMHLLFIINNESKYIVNERELILEM